MQLLEVSSGPGIASTQNKMRSGGRETLLAWQSFPQNNTQHEPQKTRECSGTKGTNSWDET